MPIANEAQNKLKGVFGELEISIPRENRMFIKTDLTKTKEVIRYLKENFGMIHITTITAIDAGESIELLYHFFTRETTITIKTSVAKNNPVIDTITPIIPGAILYEREIQDLLGIKVKGHPDPRRLVLPEDWEEGVYPLRKEYKVPGISASIKPTTMGREEKSGN